MVFGVCVTDNRARSRAGFQYKFYKPLYRCGKKYNGSGIRVQVKKLAVRFPLVDQIVALQLRDNAGGAIRPEP